MPIFTHEELKQKISDLESKADELAKQLSINDHTEQKLQEIADGISLLAYENDDLLENFKRNMLAFKEFDNQIYQFFANYHPTNFLVDIESGFPNIFDVKKNQNIYKYPSLLMALAQLKEYKEKPQSTNSAFEFDTNNNNDFIHNHFLNKVIKVLDERYNKEKDIQRGLPNDVSSLVIFGVGTGYHIEQLVNQHHIKNLYIVEPELDFFYASLFIINWESILTKLDQQACNLHLCLGVTGDAFFDDLLNQTYQNGRYSIVKTFGYIHYNTPKINELLKIFKERFKEMIQGWGFFDDGVMAVAHTLGNLNNGVGLLKKSAKNLPFCQGLPVFIIGNGPSLDQSIDQIKKYQNKAIIISCGSALSALMRYGISVDYHCEQERTLPVYDKVKAYGNNHEFCDLILLAPSTLHPRVYELFDKGIMCPKAREPSTSSLLMDNIIKNDIEATSFVNPTVANTAISMGYALGYREFYLFGVDLGHRQDGHHHSQKSLYYSDEGDDLSLYKTEKSKNIVPGNFSGEFVCDDFFNMSRRMIEKLLAAYEEIQCFNVSDGARIRGAHTLARVDLSQRTDINKHDHVHSVYAAATYNDEDKKLYESILSHSSPDDLQEFCDALRDIIQEDINDIKQGITMLREQTNVMIKASNTEKAHFVMLLEGSLLHFQAMLTRLLHEANQEQEAIDDFNQAKQYFIEFLVCVPSFYSEHYNTPQVSSCNWWGS